MDRNFKLLTKKQIYERFDVEYINKLIEYSDNRNPIGTKTAIHKALFEEFGSEDKPNKLNELKDLEHIDDTENVQIPKALFDEMMKFLNNNKK
tara:strand:- start:63 stop:341 length:279 start_codon:yes stop_codon:yes gene_type:complete